MLTNIREKIITPFYTTVRASHDLIRPSDLLLNAVWNYVNREAAYKPKVVPWGYGSKPVKCEPGQLVIALRALAAELGASKNAIARCIKFLKRQGLILIEHLGFGRRADGTKITVMMHLLKAGGRPALEPPIFHEEEQPQTGAAYFLHRDTDRDTVFRSDGADFIDLSKSGISDRDTDRAGSNKGENLNPHSSTPRSAGARACVVPPPVLRCTEDGPTLLPDEEEEQGLWASILSSVPAYFSGVPPASQPDAAAAPSAQAPVVSKDQNVEVAPTATEPERPKEISGKVGEILTAFVTKIGKPVSPAQVGEFAASYELNETAMGAVLADIDLIASDPFTRHETTSINRLFHMDKVKARLLEWRQHWAKLILQMSDDGLTEAAIMEALLSSRTCRGINREDLVSYFSEEIKKLREYMRSIAPVYATQLRAEDEVVLEAALPEVLICDSKISPPVFAMVLLPKEPEAALESPEPAAACLELAEDERAVIGEFEAVTGQPVSTTMLSEFVEAWRQRTDLTLEGLRAGISFLAGHPFLRHGKKPVTVLLDMEAVHKEALTIDEKWRERIKMLQASRLAPETILKTLFMARGVKDMDKTLVTNYFSCLTGDPQSAKILA